MVEQYIATAPSPVERPISLRGMVLNSWDDIYLCDDCATRLRVRRGRELVEPKDAPVPRGHTAHVYFIGHATGPVKIGKAVNPSARLREIQTGYPYKLSILALVDGGHDVERAYHKRFASARLTGEWFTRCPEIEAEIARLSLERLGGGVS